MPGAEMFEGKWQIFWLVVWNIFIFPYIGNNHPNWLIFLRGVGIPPTIHHLDQKEDLDLIAIVQFLNPVK